MGLGIGGEGDGPTTNITHHVDYGRWVGSPPEAQVQAMKGSKSGVWSQGSSPTLQPPAR